MDKKKIILWFVIVIVISFGWAFLEENLYEPNRGEQLDSWFHYDTNSSSEESYLIFSGHEVVIPNPTGFTKIDRSISSTKLFFENLDSHPKMKAIVAYCKNYEAPNMLTEEIFWPEDMHASIMVDNQYVHVKMSESEFAKLKQTWKEQGSKISKEAFTRINPLVDSGVDKINQAFGTDIKLEYGAPLTLAIHDESDKHFSWLTFVKQLIDEEDYVNVTCTTMFLAGSNQLQLGVTGDERNTNEIMAISKDWVSNILKN